MSTDSNQSVFVSGMYLNRVHDSAPSFIITNQSVHVDTLIKWLQEHKDLADTKGYIKLQGKESKTLDDKGFPKRYFQVDFYKPTEKTEAPVVPEYPQGTEEEPPF